MSLHKTTKKRTFKRKTSKRRKSKRKTSKRRKSKRKTSKRKTRKRRKSKGGIIPIIAAGLMYEMYRKSKNPES